MGRRMQTVAHCSHVTQYQYYIQHPQLQEMFRILIILQFYIESFVSFALFSSGFSIIVLKISSIRPDFIKDIVTLKTMGPLHTDPMLTYRLVL
jgi:hypothetical protein